MTEPTYHFVRGQGWIPTPEGLNSVYVNRPEIQFRLELRNPKPGERYGVFYVYSEHHVTGEKYVKDGVLDIALFARYMEGLENFRLDSWGIWRDNSTRENTTYYCTFVMK